MSNLASVARVVADSQEKTKGYIGRIAAAVAEPEQCIGESNLSQGTVGYDTRYVGKVINAIMSISNSWVVVDICTAFFELSGVLHALCRWLVLGFMITSTANP